jgi:hypothetical protein
MRRIGDNRYQDDYDSILFNPRLEGEAFKLWFSPGACHDFLSYFKLPVICFNYVNCLMEVNIKIHFDFHAPD